MRAPSSARAGATRQPRWSRYDQLRRQSQNDHLDALGERTIYKLDALGDLGCLLYRTGRLAESGEAFKQALGSHRAANNARFLGLHSCDYAATLAALGEAKAAMERWNEGASVLKALKPEGLLEGKAAAAREACQRANVEPRL